MPAFRKPFDWVGPTPWQDIKTAFELLLPHGMFRMDLKTPQDVKAAAAAWNQGIDSRQEAIFRPCVRKWMTKEKSELRLVFDITGLLVFLRRLYEDGGDEALDLRSAILQTLSIVEVSEE